MINKSFQLLRTNPLLTTNFKVVVNSNYELFMESFNTNNELSNINYKHYKLNKTSLLESRIPYFYKQLPKELAFDVKYDKDNQVVQTDFSKQFDTIYQAGASYIEDKWHKEEFEYFAPLYIRKNNLPSGFIILRVDDPSSYGSDVTNNYQLNSLDKNNFRSEIIDKWKCVKYFDMSYTTNLGVWLYNNFLNNKRFPKSPFEYNPEKTELSSWYGIDYGSGIYTQKTLYMEDRNSIETPHFKFEKFITEGFKRNDLIFPNILNLKFLFDDTPATPNDFRKYSMNRYYGFYIDNLDYVCSITSYVTPEMSDGTILLNNIILGTGVTEENCIIEDFYNIYFSGETKYISVNPFKEEWDETKDYYIFFDNSNDLQRQKVISGLYPVKRLYQHDRWMYKVISDDTMDAYWNTGYTNIKTANIKYTNGYNVVKPYIIDSTGVTEDTFFIDKYRLVYSGYTTDTGITITETGTTIFITGDTIEDIFKSGQLVKIVSRFDREKGFTGEIISYDNVNGVFEILITNINGDVGDQYEEGCDIHLIGGQIKYMYGDLYLINIDGVYHIIKYYEGGSINELMKDDNGNFRNQYYIQTDYGVNLTSEYVEYWIGGKNSEYYKKTYINITGQTPTTYPIYRLKFSDIKDFDFDRIDTGYADFDFEKTEYVETEEEKLYCFDYNDDSVPPGKRLGGYGSENQDKIENISSEYIADDELFEITPTGSNKKITLDDGTIEEEYDLNDMWRKNQSIVKWGYVGSNSHSDYPYKLNNNNEVGGIYNRTTNPFLTQSDILSKNLDYFYRLGNFYSGATSNYIYYKNQSTNIQQDDFLESDLKRFDINSYFNLFFDYFTYFFRNKMIYEDNGNEFSKNFEKYSTFNGGDENIYSTTLFKGIKFKIKEVKNIYIEDGVISKILYGNKNYNDYKFSIVFNENYKEYPTFGVFDPNAIINTTEDCVNIIINEKYKNVLIVLNTSIRYDCRLNDLSKYDEKNGLYFGKEILGDTGITTYYNPNTFSASNFIMALNDYNGDYGLKVKYYVIKEINNQLYYGGTFINDTSNSTMTNIPDWPYSHTSFVLTVDFPTEIELNNNCYWTDPYYIESLDDDYGSTILNFDENDTNKVSIYRYQGYYEPIFKDVDLFKGGYFYFDLDYTSTFINGNLSSKPRSYTQEQNDNIQFVVGDLSAGQSIIKCNAPNRISDFKSPTIYFTDFGLSEDDFDIDCLSIGEFGGGTIDPIQIVGLEFEVDRQAINNTIPLTTYCIDTAVNLKNVSGTDRKNVNKWSSGFETITYGGQTDTWDSSVTKNDLLNNNFGLSIMFNIHNEDAFIDDMGSIIDVRLRVYFRCKYSSETETHNTGSHSAQSINYDYDINAIMKKSSPILLPIFPLEFKAPASTDEFLTPILTLYNIDFKSIPSGLTSTTSLLGLEIKMKRYSNYNSDQIYVEDNVFRLETQSMTYADKAFSGRWGTNKTEVIYGGPTDLWDYGTPLYTDDILRGDFSIKFQMKIKNSSDLNNIIIAVIDYIVITAYYEVENKLYTYSNKVYFDNNYKFDTNLTNFGKIDETIYSKVNEDRNFLNNMLEDYLIYPRIDEYGYGYSDRFIFKSSWDKNYFIRTKSTSNYL